MNKRSESAETAPAARPAAESIEDPYTARWADWLRQLWQIQADSLAGWTALLGDANARASSAKGMAEWMEVAGAFSREAAEEFAKRESEWLAAVTQCQMQAAKMLVDLGAARLQGADARACAAGSAEDGGRQAAATWFRPWLAWPGLRPVQIA